MEIFLSIALIIFLAIQSGVICWVLLPLKSKKSVALEKDDYSEYDKDFKFLHYLIDRERTVAINFVLAPMEIQYDEKMTINDDDVEKIVSDCCRRVLGSLVSKYQIFLIEKYFGSQESLIQYIVEDIQLFITSEAIKKNLNRARNNLIRNKTDSIFNLNGVNTNTRNEKAE